MIFSELGALFGLGEPAVKITASGTEIISHDNRLRRELSRRFSKNTERVKVYFAEGSNPGPVIAMPIQGTLSHSAVELFSGGGAFHCTLLFSSDDSKRIRVPLRVRRLVSPFPDWAFIYTDFLDLESGREFEQYKLKGGLAGLVQKLNWLELQSGTNEGHNLFYRCYNRLEALPSMKALEELIVTASRLDPTTSLAEVVSLHELALRRQSQNLLGKVKIGPIMPFGGVEDAVFTVDLLNAEATEKLANAFVDGSLGVKFSATVSDGYPIGLRVINAWKNKSGTLTVALFAPESSNRVMLGALCLWGGTGKIEKLELTSGQIKISGAPDHWLAL